jgi:hypothetical protein
MIAAFRSRGVQIRGVTWLDRTTRERELPTVMGLAAYADIQHVFGMRQRYAVPGAVFIRGYGAEVIRGFYRHTMKAPIKAMRASELLRAYGLGRPKSTITAPEMLQAQGARVRTGQIGREYAKRVGLAAFEGFMERANYDERLMGWGFDLNDVFYWEHRMGMWGAAMHNEMDPVMLSMTGFNSREVYEAGFGMDPGKRLTKALLLEVIRRYDEPMAEIPYF